MTDRPPRGRASISSAEHERLVMLFRKEHAGMVDPPPLGPEVHANLMVNNTPAVARKWLEDEGLLDEQQTKGANPCTDPLGDAITVLENMRVTTEPMEPWEMGDIEQRRITALGYLRMIGTHRAMALIEGIRARTDHPLALEMLDELERLVSPRYGEEWDGTQLSPEAETAHREAMLETLKARGLEVPEWTPRKP